MLSSCNGPQGHAGQYAAGLGNCMAWERPGQTGIWNWRRLASNSTTAQPCQTLLPTGLPLGLQGNPHLQLLEGASQ